MEDPLSQLAQEYKKEEKKPSKKELSQVEKELISHEIRTTEIKKDTLGKKEDVAKVNPMSLVQSSPEEKKGPKETRKAEKPKPSTKRPKETPGEGSARMVVKDENLIDIFEDEWADRGKFPGESPMLKCPFVFASPDQRIQADGQLTITSYLLYFEPDDPKRIPGGARHLVIPVACIGKMSTKKATRGEDVSVSLNLITRDHRHLKFVYSTNKAFARRTKHVTPEQVEQMLKIVAFPDSVKNLFAFWYAKQRPCKQTWGLYNADDEFRRMGVNDSYECQFRMTDCNKNYRICDSYPERLCVTKMVTEEELLNVALFRNRGRIPVMTWKLPKRPVSMFRCSQPKVGLSMNRSAADEHYLKTIFMSNSCHKDPALWIFDCRPKLYAMGNMVKGAGYENMDNYPFSKLYFMGIDNIHGMREAREKMGKAVHVGKGDEKWLSQVENSKWLNYLCILLKGTYLVVKVMTQDRCSVLIHCSDGWDRTSQVCALSQLCMDPYYRTFEGFLVLIDKDWIGFGHQFHTRCSHGQPSDTSSQAAPIFEQYIEACAELVRQFPTAFEFTDDFLILILKHLYSCRFGTFLFNHDKDRHTHKLYDSTISLWYFLLNHPEKQSFTNPFYKKTSTYLFPQSSIKKIALWSKLHQQHSPEALLTPSKPRTPLSSLEKAHRVMKQENVQLKEKLQSLQKRYASLQRSKEANIFDTDPDV